MLYVYVEIILLGAMLTLYGCGYRFVGAVPKEGPVLKRVGVGFFQNRTTETGIEAAVTDLVIQELNSATILRVVRPGEGDLRLNGTIVEFRNEPRAYSRRNILVEYRATLTLDVSLLDSRTGRVLWHNRRLSGFEDYVCARDILNTERNKLLAIKAIAADLGERIRIRIEEEILREYLKAEGRGLQGPPPGKGGDT